MSYCPKVDLDGLVGIRPLTPCVHVVSKPWEEAPSGFSAAALPGHCHQRPSGASVF